MASGTQMNKYDIHPDFLKYKRLKLPMNAAILPVINFFLTRAFYRAEVPDGLTETRQTIAGYQGASIKLTVLSPAIRDKALPALVYFHGGAFAMQSAPYLKRIAANYSLKTPCVVLLADYRLLPKAKFPIGLEDCYAAYKWVNNNSDKLEIDGSRIAVGGDSAGGALSIGVCMLARDRKARMPCFQLLVYPVTDRRQTTDSMKRFTDTPLWNSKLNAKMWRMYLKGGQGEANAYASPAEAAEFSGMPPTYIETAEYDPLRDEGIAFAGALRECGVPVELHQTCRTIHGFEIAEKNEIVIESIERRVEMLRKAFAWCSVGRH